MPRRCAERLEVILDKAEAASKAWHLGKMAAGAVNQKVDQLTERLAPNAPKEVKGTIAGVITGAAVGSAIGGIGIAALGTAVGLPASAVLAVGAGLVGNRWGISKDRKELSSRKRD